MCVGVEGQFEVILIWEVAVGQLDLGALVDIGGRDRGGQHLVAAAGFLPLFFLQLQLKPAFLLLFHGSFLFSFSLAVKIFIWHAVFMDYVVHIPAYFAFVAPHHHIFDLVDYHRNLHLYYVGDGNGYLIVDLVGLTELLGVCYFGLRNQTLVMSYFADNAFFIFFEGGNPVFFC